MKCVLREKDCGRMGFARLMMIGSVVAMCVGLMVVKVANENQSSIHPHSSPHVAHPATQASPGTLKYPRDPQSLCNHYGVFNSNPLSSVMIMG